MRPPLGGENPPRTRDLTSAPCAARPTSFFLCSESDLNAGSPATSPPRRPSVHAKGPTTELLKELAARPEPTTSTTASSPAKHSKPSSSANTLSQPVTPLMSGNLGSGLASTPTSISLHSMADSDDEAVVDDAAQSDTEGPIRAQEPVDPPGPSAPQLIMPSLTIPKRRPFTDKGRQMGRFKILIAGREGKHSGSENRSFVANRKPTGAGKSSLIRAVAQACDDIVHIDDIPQKRRQKEAVVVQASTKPLPMWWDELDESPKLRKRRSSDDTVLDRNICFIDTPNFSSAVEYISSMLLRNVSISEENETDLFAVLAGNGGFQVDVVLYLFADGEHIPHPYAKTPFANK